MVDHGLGDVGVDAFDSWHAVANSLVLEGFVGVVFVEPGFVGVPEPVECQARLDGCPASFLVSGDGGSPDAVAEVGAA